MYLKPFCYPDLEITDEETKRKIRLYSLSIALDLMGNPQDKLKFIHMTGTNGKGSTSAMIASILQAAGYKVGLFTSPHIKEINENIQINFEPISFEDMTRIETEVYKIFNDIHSKPFANAVRAAIAIKYFAEQNVDIVVFEVGAGGKNDPTNVIATTEAAVMVNMEIDHTNLFGDTLEEITYNKAHILKPGCDFILYPSYQIVEDVMRKACADFNIPFHKADFSQLTILRNDLHGQIINYKDYERICLPLLGDHQPYNMATAIEVIEVLINRGWSISKKDIYYGLSKLKWPGRLEVLRYAPNIICDAAHNPQGLEVLFNSIDYYYPNKNKHFVFGCMRDKDILSMLKLLKNQATSVYFTKGEGIRPLKANKVLELYESIGGVGVACNDTAEAVDLCKEHLKTSDDIMIGTGTFRLIGDFKDRVFEIYPQYEED